MSDELIHHGSYAHMDSEPMRWSCKDCLQSQNQALQERAEKAEAALREIRDWDEGSGPFTGTHAAAAVAIADRALSPTQETEERCTCGAAAEVAGGHLADCPFYRGWLRPNQEEGVSFEGLSDSVREALDRLSVRGAHDSHAMYQARLDRRDESLAALDSLLTEYNTLREALDAVYELRHAHRMPADLFWEAMTIARKALEDR